MRDRWILLLMAGCVGLLGGVWEVTRHPAALPSWFWLGSFVVVCGVVMRAAIQDLRVRWPAAVALLGVAPLLHDIASLSGEANPLWAASKWTIDIGSVFVLIVALAILLTRPVAPKRDPIAPVRLL
jgi:hypothetical protein